MGSIGLSATFLEQQGCETESIDGEWVATCKVMHAPIKFDAAFADNAREPAAMRTSGG